MNIEFTGDFKKLIPMGFTFHKLFASNYKVYEKSKVWIWVAQGGYVEVADFHELSGYIVKAIWEGTFPVHDADVIYGGRTFFKKGDRRSCMINMETGEIIERREFFKRYGKGDGTYGEEYDYDLFREVSIRNETIHFIEELKDLNILKIKA
jgi:hypothetical protein